MPRKSPEWGVHHTCFKRKGPFRTHEEPSISKKVSKHTIERVNRKTGKRLRVSLWNTHYLYRENRNFLLEG